MAPSGSPHSPRQHHSHPHGHSEGSGRRPRHVFVDIDNTLTYYGTQDLIPGALRFIHELRADMDDPKAAPEAPSVTVLTARPDLGDSYLDLLRTLLVVDGSSICNDALHGKFFADVILPDLFKNDQKAGDKAICEALAQRKVGNIEQWIAQRKPRHPLVFVGDNGEGDVEAAVEMLRRGLIRCAFIRSVGPSDTGLFLGKRPSDVAHPHVFLYDNYAQAAHLAHKAGLISDAARRRVVEAAESPTAPKTIKHCVAKALLYGGETASIARRLEGRSFLSRWANRNVVTASIAVTAQDFAGQVMAKWHVRS